MIDVRPSLRDRKKDATRQQIENVAWELFTTQGFDETTVQQIADAANVAPRTFFRYFPTKEAVLYPELDGLLDELARAFFERPVDEPALVSLIAAFDSIGDRMNSDRGRQFERFELLKKSGSGTSSEFVTQRVTDRLAEIVRQRYDGQPDADLRAQLAAGVISTLMRISTEQWLAKGASGDMDDEAKYCFALLRTLVTG